MVGVCDAAVFTKPAGTAELGFVHPVTAKPLRFQVPLPPDLTDFWKQFKKPNANASGKGPGTKDKGQRTTDD